MIVTHYSLMLQFYIDDNDAFPVVTHANQARNDKNKARNLESGLPILTTALFPYVGNKEVFSCPADIRGVNNAYYETGGASCYEAWGTSYDYNWRMCYVDNVPLMYDEGGSCNDISRYKPVAANGLPTYVEQYVLVSDFYSTGVTWHAQAARPFVNLLYLDGHITGEFLPSRGNTGKRALEDKLVWR